MSDVTHEAGALRGYGLKLVDSLYDLSFYLIVAYGGAMVMLALVGAAVASNIVGVPEFHPK